jgi:flagellin-like protein
MKYGKNEEAVSPVIGVILMVAITVILAGVIATFVFGMAGNFQKTKLIAITAHQLDVNSIIVTYQGGQDAHSLNGANVTITADTGLTTPCTAIIFYPRGPAIMGSLGSSVGSSVTAICTTPATGGFVG